MTPQLSIVIPLRQGSSAYFVLRSLGEQSYQSLEIVLSQDLDSNANCARNAGYRLTSPCTQFLLFSDDDICWRPDGIARMIQTLETTPGASYSYGTYEMGGRLFCDQPFDPEILKRRNYISTMSVIRRAHFPGFDEDIQRLQDWALWIRMLQRGHVGAHCGCIIFSTQVRDGITRGGKVSYEEAYRIVSEKYLSRPVAL